MERNGIVRHVWLQMLAEGGYTTLSEIRQTFAESPRVDRILQTLADQGCCVVVEDPERKNGIRYGVTPSCKVPRDVSLQDINKAVGMA